MAWTPPAWATDNADSTAFLEVYRADVFTEVRTQVYLLAEHKALVLGRQATFSQHFTSVLVQDSSVSRQHAALVHKDSELFVIDLNSVGGVTANGVRAKPLVATPIEEETVILLSEAPYRFVLKGVKTWSGYSPSWAIAPAAPVAMFLQGMDSGCAPTPA